MTLLSSMGQHRSPCQCPRSEAFTLIELLVVISIIALLVAILLPALSQAQRSAKTIQCMSNLRQMGVAEFNYANDFDGWLPLAYDSSVVDSPIHGANWFWWKGPWIYRLQPYVGHPPLTGGVSNLEARQMLGDGMFHCPGKPNWTVHSTQGGDYISYAQNKFSAWSASVGKRLSGIVHASRMLLVCDTGAGSTVMDNVTHNWIRHGATKGGGAAPTFWHPNYTNNVLCADGHVVPIPEEGLIGYNATKDHKMLLKAH